MTAIQLGLILLPGFGVICAFLVLRDPMAAWNNLTSAFSSLAKMNLFFNAALLLIEVPLIVGQLLNWPTTAKAVIWLDSQPFGVPFGLWLSDLWATYSSICIFLAARFATYDESNLELRSKTVHYIALLTVLIIIKVTAARILIFDLVKSAHDEIFISGILALSFVALFLISRTELALRGGRHVKSLNFADTCFVMLVPLYAPITTGILQAQATLRAFKSALRGGAGESTQTSHGTALIQASGLVFFTVALMPFSVSLSPFYPLATTFDNAAALLLVLYFIFGLAVLAYDIQDTNALGLTITIQVVLLTLIHADLEDFVMVASDYFLGPPGERGDGRIPFDMVLMQFLVFAGLTVTFIFCSFVVSPWVITKKRPALAVVFIMSTLSIIAIWLSASASWMIFSVSGLSGVVVQFAQALIELEQVAPGTVNWDSSLARRFVVTIAICLSLPIIWILFISFLLNIKEVTLAKHLDMSNGQKYVAAWTRRFDSRPELRRIVRFSTSPWPRIIFAALALVISAAIIIESVEWSYVGKLLIIIWNNTVTVS